MKKWSDKFRLTGQNRSSWYILKLKNDVRKILNLISGNDIIEMLKDVLTQKEKRNLVDPKHEHALKELAYYYKKSDLKKRHFFIRPLRNTSINFSEIRRLGFRVSKHLWNTCSNTNERNKEQEKSLN
ncbi:hypothetical protein BpHYR1_036032 [Brachionus plicatilis]|uniref:Uncharacterized protein n=1 Tax=Brachionus plicatilis TaxID=10195 RepID=A0A3M7SL99_BRAPC|nr:hypothetical protein BpHYR1_036032 [Brachionus plicatilis]